MPFILLVFFSALLLEVIGSYISITGLAAKTGIIVVIIAVALDLAKIVIASALYKKWKSLNVLMKIYLLPVLLVLISVTSAGAFGYLSQEFGKTILSQEKSNSQLLVLQEEREKKTARRDQINNQIERLPSDQVNQRRRLIETYAAEIQNLDARITALDEEIPKLRLSALEEGSSNGTIGSIVKNTNLPPETVIKYLTLFMVLFIDPLAIVLLILGNFLIEERKREKLAAATTAVGKLEEKVLEAVHADTKEPEVVREVIKEVQPVHVQSQENDNLVKDYQYKDNKVLAANVLPEFIPPTPEIKEVIKEVVKEVPIIQEVIKEVPVVHTENRENDQLMQDYISCEDALLESSVANEREQKTKSQESAVVSQEAMIENHEVAEGTVVSQRGEKKLVPSKFDFNALLNSKKNHDDLDQMSEFINKKDKKGEEDEDMPI